MTINTGTSEFAWFYCTFIYRLLAVESCPTRDTKAFVASSFYLLAKATIYTRHLSTFVNIFRTRWTHETRSTGTCKIVSTINTCSSIETRIRNTVINVYFTSCTSKTRETGTSKEIKIACANTIVFTGAIRTWVHALFTSFPSEIGRTVTKYSIYKIHTYTIVQTAAG